MKRKPLPAAAGSPWYRLADVMRLFDCSERTVWTWTAEGRLPQPVRSGARWTRWAKEAVDAKLASMTGKEIGV